MDKKKFTKFWYLFGYSLARRVKTKAFLISNIIIGILVIALINITSIISFFGGSFDETSKVFIFDESGKNVQEIYSGYFAEGSIYENAFEIEVKSDFSADKMAEYQEEATIVLVIALDDANFIKADIYADSLPMTDEMVLRSSLSTLKTQVWMADNSDLAGVIVGLNAPAEATLHLTETDSDAAKQLILSVASTILSVPIMLLITFMIQFVGADIIEEKSSKAIEVIISNVPAGQHFASKILSGIVFLVIQGGLLLFYCLIGVIIALSLSSIDIFDGSLATTISEAIGIESSLISDIIAQIPAAVLMLSLFTIAGFVLYAVSVAVLSSMSTNMEDYQTFQTPIMLCLVAGFYIALFGSQFEGSVFVKAMGYVPFFSPMIAPILFVAGEFTIIEALISLAVLVAFDFVVVRFGVPLYKTSILSFSQEPFFKRIKKLINKSKYSD